MACIRGNIRMRENCNLVFGSEVWLTNTKYLQVDSSFQDFIHPFTNALMNTNLLNGPTWSAFQHVWGQDVLGGDVDDLNCCR